MTTPGEPIKVVFEPEGRRVEVPHGTSILDAARAADIALETPCGGKGHCGKCRMQVISGASEPNDAERKLFSAAQLKAGMRLACQNHLTGAAVISIPNEARFFGQKILEDGISRDVVPNPSFRKAFLKVPSATLEDQTCDLDRVKVAVAAWADGRGLKAEGPQSIPGAITAGLPVIRSLPAMLHEADAFTAVLKAGEVVAFEKGDTASACYGVAVDIGTTTVVGLLVDLLTGKQLLAASRINPQVARGDDVISRLTHVREHHSGLKDLHDRIVGCINEIVGELCEKTGVPAEHIYELAAVGNTTMSHIFMGVNCGKLAESPFAAVVREAANVHPGDLGVKINPHGNVYVAPNIAGFVGGDTVGVIVATGLMHGSGARLAIDIGTNGELVLAAKGRVISCSTAAGPAFEGARIKMGMRAAHGAIDKVVFNSDVEFTTIGNALPRGICGTGLIDSVAEMVRTGVVDYTGRIIDPDEAPLPENFSRRIARNGDSNEFVLVNGDKSHNGQHIVLTQRDVREVQLAKGAMRAGIEILLTELGLTAQDIDEVYLAGAFGNFIRKRMAKGIGLLPDVDSGKIKFVGNAAGTGARMLLASKDFRAEADRISTAVRYVELAGRPDFQQAFAMSMLFPMSNEQ